MRGVFVTGTDTGVGKTVVSAALLAGAAEDVRYWKPVQTGVPPDDDTATVRALSGAGPERVLDRGVRLKLPASPHHAAAAEGVTLDLDGILAPILHEPEAGRWIVEGAGGLLVPLSDEALMTDLIAALGLPVLLVSSTRLGTINQTLLTLRQLDALGLPTLGVVLVGPPDPSADTGLAAHHPAPILARFPIAEPLDAAATRRFSETLLANPRLAEVLS